MEKQLSYESVYNEKQRSVIEICKHIISDNMDDSTILTFISSLEEELENGTKQSKYEIREELQ